MDGMEFYYLNVKQSIISIIPHFKSFILQLSLQSLVNSSPTCHCFWKRLSLSSVIVFLQKPFDQRLSSLFTLFCYAASCAPCLWDEYEKSLHQWEFSFGGLSTLPSPLGGKPRRWRRNLSFTNQAGCRQLPGTKAESVMMSFLFRDITTTRIHQGI